MNNSLRNLHGLCMGKLQEIIEEVDSIGRISFAKTEKKSHDHCNARPVYVSLVWNREIGKSKCRHRLNCTEMFQDTVYQRKISKIRFKNL